MDDLARDQRALHLTAARLMGTGKTSPSLQRSQVPRQLLLVIDQFEELFTLCRDETERQAFIDNIMTAASEPGARGM
jgi:hypothetical protein